MVDFLDGRLQDVWLDRLFPLLRHNDMLRLRRVCKTTKQMSTRYLWTFGNQGSWELQISSFKEFKSVLDLELSPPSRIRFLCGLNFESEELSGSLKYVDYSLVFMSNYGKYITHLHMAYVRIPFVSADEIEFFENLTNLTSLTIDFVHTGGPLNFEMRHEMKGSRLIPLVFKNVKILKLGNSDNLTLAYELINETGENLERLSMPYSADSRGVAMKFIEKFKRMKYFDCDKVMQCLSPLECLFLFEVCYRNGVKLVNVPSSALECLLVDRNTGLVDREMIYDEAIMRRQYRFDYQRNVLVGVVIHSMKTDWLSSFVLLLDMPSLEELDLNSIHRLWFSEWRSHGCPNWPNLKKIDVHVTQIKHVRLVEDLLHFLWTQSERTELEEFSIRFHEGISISISPTSFGLVSCHLKKLSIENCHGSNTFFEALWENLPMLETVNLSSCRRLGNNGFIGKNFRQGHTPVFMKLRRLKHLKIENIGISSINDNLFRIVIRNLKLSSLELSSHGNLRRISVEGVKVLLTGDFADTIERLKLRQLRLRGVSVKEMKELESLFRSSQMI